MRFATTPVLALLMAALLGAGPAKAADRVVAQACRADYKKLCSGVKPGDGRGAQCMKQHEAELSDGCKSAMAGAARCVEKVREVCGAAGGDAVARKACIREHAAELGDCKNAG